MTRAQLVAVEGIIVLVGLLLLYLIAGLPVASGDPTPVVVEGTDFIAAVRHNGGSSSGSEASIVDPEARTVDSQCGIPTDRDFFAANQIVSYYGNPYTGDMGILGQLSPPDLVERVKEQARDFDGANGFRGVQPALHLVSTTAQPHPGSDGRYVLHVDDETLAQYVDLACEAGLLVFLDLQIGRSDLAAEIQRIRPFLEQPHVHLALDPEFAMDEGEIPGQVIGEFDAGEINYAQEVLQEIAESKGISDKVLIVHQFTESMIERPGDIADYARVRVIVDMDGFGDPASKRQKFIWHAQPAEYSGIKLFFQQDQPNMTSLEVAKLRPDLVIYQ